MGQATELCVALENRPGTLGKLCGALSRAKVNVEAICVAENSECCWVRLVASPLAGAKKALSKGGFHFTTRRVLTLGAHNQPGELASIAARLGKAGVNINYIYGSNAPGGRNEMVVLSVSDLAKAGAALGG
jgi:hypothetical protein